MPQVYLDSRRSGFYDRVAACREGETLYAVLERQGLLPPGAVCRGAGVCRGCRVLIAEEGMECLACRYPVTRDLHIVLPDAPAEQTILFETDPKDVRRPDESSRPQMAEPMRDMPLPADAPLGLAVDVGTTTIASALVNLETGAVCARAGCMNRQARCGADVISRIRYAVEEPGGADTLHNMLRQDIEDLLAHYRRTGCRSGQLRRISFSGNPTMLHTLLNRPLGGMAGYPFTPDFLDGRRETTDGMEILILPGKSAFVGADVAAGCRACGLGQSDAYELLLDLGTNGEIWLLNRAGGLCTSASCGPAFANSVRQGSLYGTTLLEQLAVAYRAGQIDETGLIQEPYFESGIDCGEWILTQETVRELQLAKAAIRTGVDLAAYELRIPLTEITRVCMAGGFGFYLDPAAAYDLGLLPEELRGRVQIAGNASLRGAIQSLLDPDAWLTLPDALARSRSLDLSMSKNFQELFLHRLNFPPLT